MANSKGARQVGEGSGKIRINRAQVLTLWAAVAERLGFDRPRALTAWAKP